MTKKFKIAQVGTFDVENFGDLLFPDVLSNKLGNCDIDLFSPVGGIKPFTENTKVYSIHKLDEMCQQRNYKAILVGGGDIIRLDSHISTKYASTISKSLQLWQTPILIAAKYHIPVLFNAPGAPFYFLENQEQIVNDVLKACNYISVRDFPSRCVLNKCGIKCVKVVPDTIFCINDVYDKTSLERHKLQLEKDGLVPKVKDFLIFQHNLWNYEKDEYLNEISQFLNYLTSDLDLNVLFMPIGYVHNDEKFMNRVYEESNQNMYFVKNKLTPKDMLSLIASSDGYIGTSMHGAITSCCYDKPILCINPIDLFKINGFLEQIGLTRNQVKDIKNIREVYDDCFCAPCPVNINSVKNKINNHFLELNKYIGQDNSDFKYNNYFPNVLISCFTHLPSKQTNINEISIYYDLSSDQNYSFNEDNLVNKRITNDNGVYTFELDLDNKYSAIRIDPIEGEFIEIENLKICLDGTNIAPEINNSISFNSKTFIHSLDPQIIVQTKNCKKLKFTAKINILHGKRLDSWITKYNNLYYEAKNDLNIIKRKYKRTLYHKIDSVYHLRHK